MTAPLDTGADPATITSITQALATLDRQRTIDETGANPAQYGLGTPKLQIDFTTNDGASHTLSLGESNPTKASLYATRDGSPAVFLVPQYQESTFNKSTFDLRDKSILTFKRDDLKSLALTADGHTVDLDKAGESEWRMTAPVKARADFGTVEGVVSKLQTTQMKSVVTSEAPSAADLRKYGLEHPAITATLQTGATPLTLDIGGDAGSDTLYARTSARPGVFTVESALAGDLRRAPDEYRRHDLFDFRAYNATKVELTRNGKTTTFERTKGQGEGAADSWRRTTPAPAADADKDKVDAMLAKLADLRADSFVSSTAGTGLANPVLTVHVTFNDGTDQEQVTFGQSNGAAYAAVPNDAGAAKVDNSALGEVLSALDELAG
jgi:phage host-nuclease inhibitor protein Gam